MLIKPIVSVSGVIVSNWNNGIWCYRERISCFHSLVKRRRCLWCFTLCVVQLRSAYTLMMWKLKSVTIVNYMKFDCLKSPFWNDYQDNKTDNDLCFISCSIVTLKFFLFVGLTYAATAIGVAAGFFLGGQFSQNYFVDFDRVNQDR